MSGWGPVGETVIRIGELMAGKLVLAFEDAVAEMLSRQVARSSLRCRSERCDELVGEVWDLLAEAPSGAGTLEYLRENRVTVVPIWGSGSAYSPLDGRIYLDISQGAARAALDLAHEATHHEYDHGGLRPDPRQTPQQQWVDAMVGEETEATARGVEVGNDLAEQGAGMGGVDYPGRDAYNQAADAAEQAAEAADPGGDPAGWDEAGRQAGRSAVRRALEDGTYPAGYDPSGNGISYPDYYGDDWQGRQR
ncbi:MAG: hypothetical protein AB2L07_18875 [Thermoanaerobaculaceae bacterium]